MDEENLQEVAKTWLPPHELSVFSTPRPVRLTIFTCFILVFLTVFNAISLYNIASIAKRSHSLELAWLLLPPVVFAIFLNSLRRDWRHLKMGTPCCGMITAVHPGGKGKRTYDYAYVSPAGQLIKRAETRGFYRFFEKGAVVTVLELPGERTAVLYPPDSVVLKRKTELDLEL